MGVTMSDDGRLSAEEVEAALARGEVLAYRPGPNDTMVQFEGLVGPVVDGHVATRAYRWTKSEQVPISKLVTSARAAAMVKANWEEGQLRLTVEIEKMTGRDPADGYGRVDIRLTLGQIRRLAEALRSADGRAAIEWATQGVKEPK